MTEIEIKSIVGKLADIARVLADADPDDKSEIFRQLGLKLASPRTFAPAASTPPAASIPATRAFGLVSPTPISRATNGAPAGCTSQRG